MRTYKTPISGSREPISNRQVRDSVSDPAFNILSFEGVFLLFPPRISSWTAIIVAKEKARKMEQSDHNMRSCFLFFKSHLFLQLGFGVSLAQSF
uniref:Uncharacterized protein n=1 Tax=Picea sitchensis TaxID=3332 RepID=D5ADE9_PICSI|nr:unknown [Picea sitchensis]